MARDRIIVLAKDPRGGGAKTRLARGPRGVEPEWAARLAEAFLLDTLALVGSFPARVQVSYAPTEARGWFKERAPGAELAVQSDGDLGARIAGAFAEAFGRGAERVVALGMDTPQLARGRLEEAFGALEVADVCLGPAHDGGYYLIGLNEPRAELFERIPWSTDAVLESTLERAAAARLSVARLAPELDVDKPSDLGALFAVLASREGAAPHTRAALVELRRSRVEPK